MSKILILANNSTGLYDFRHHLIEELMKTHSVYVVTPDDGEIDLLREICTHVYILPVDRRGTNPFKDLKLMNAYSKIIGEVRPDLVITYTIKPNIYGGILCRLKKVNYAINITGLGTAMESGGMLTRFVSTLYKFALKKAKVVFFENSSNRDRMVELGIVNESKTKVLHGAGVDLSKYSVQEYDEDEKIHFLFVGRLMREKGVEELFSAATRLHDEYPNRFILDLVGYYEDGYAERVEELEKRNVLKFHGATYNVLPYYKMCDVVVLPSYHEGMSNVLLEGASSGRPLITSNIPGCKEAVVDGVSGYLCKVKDADALYANMKRFLLLDSVSRRNMGIESRKHVEKNFDKMKVVEDTIASLW